MGGRESGTVAVWFQCWWLDYQNSPSEDDNYNFARFVTVAHAETLMTFLRIRKFFKNKSWDGIDN